MAMTIRKEDPYPDEWALTGRTRDPFSTGPLFAECHAYQVLRRELRRYAANELRGRSFLVSGHRGSGKTTLVLRAIAAVRGENKSRSIGQRPLLVKLHGPSLLMKVANSSKPPTSAEPKPGDKPNHSPPDSGKTITGLQPTDGNGSAQAALVQIMIALYRALTEEVVLYYRKFAHRGVSEGGAADFPELVGQLILELDNAPGPAVLRDFWSRIGALRQGVLWPALGSEEESSPAPRRPRVPLLGGAARLDKGYGEDQGIHEVVAISTAAQAFQVVSGCVQYQTVEKSCAKGDSTAKTESKLVAKDILYPLLGLLTGGLVGGTTWTGKDGALLSVGLGLLTALITSMTFSWTSTRTRGRSREEDHTFIHDHSVATLDRELPTVIGRIRRAGLAPVFVVDELDKVDDLSQRMKDLVERLKHIVADYSFFCFLTDRKYFESLHDRCQHEAYPREYTYFSHRLFLLYRPNDLHQYLDRLISIEPSRSSQDQEREEIGKLALSHLLLHRAMLHAFDLQRELAGVCDGEGRVIVRTGELLTYLGYRYHIMIQLAIESLLGEDDRNDRLNQDPQFGQFVYDALYLPSRKWLSGEAELDLSDEAIEDYLCERVGQMSEIGAVSDRNGEQKPPQGPDTTATSGVSGTGAQEDMVGEKSPEEKSVTESLPSITSFVREMDRQPLIDLVRGLADLLAQPKDLVDRLMKEKGLMEEETGPQGEIDPPEETDSATRKPEEVKRWAGLIGAIRPIADDPILLLLQPVDAQAHRYRWCRDPFGRHLVEDKGKPARQVVGEEVLPQQQEVNDRLIGRMEEFLEMLGGGELSPDRLASTGILLPSPDWREVQAARQRLSEHREQYDKKTLIRDQGILREYVNMLSTCSRLLACALVAGRLLGYKSGRSEAREQTVHGVLALSKVIPFGTLGEKKALERVSRLLSRYKPKSLTAVSTLTQENLNEWIASVTDACEQAGEGPREGDLPARRERVWRTWADRVEEFAKTGRSRTKPHLDQALCIAADGPAALALAKHVEHLSLYEASTVLWAALAEMRSETPGSTPLFASLPALCLLGMPPDAIDLIARLPSMIPGSGPFSSRGVTNTEIERWLALTKPAGEPRRRSSALILTEAVNGVTSKWLPSPSFGAVIVPQERLEQALRYEVLSPSLREAVPCVANFVVVFLEVEDINLEHVESARRRIPAPFPELPHFILSREPLQKTPPPPWRVLRQTQSLDDAMKEALEIIGPDRRQSDRRS